ncbi:TIGR00153 family protein [Paraglaciecola sp. 20A4]|jgi:predicted phosphate transport protein (TIGR00153 family)|uniref:TIGR00153 family protein n=1 Tax=Paraglaciecola sp. 20A4 TaxID=2687288 RepID=UPI001407B5E7|nr:TIGR00153 family protein [Paraglaciecola sp. 20A4]|tara:strand:+ start:11526 stop:12203 length:678 start_codon:yes stop_codon:yes gene_type:complete
MPTNTFLGVFAKSPLKPLENHIKVVNKCSLGLLPFFNTVFTGDWEKAALFQREISNLEKQADTLKRELRISLPRGIFMPIQRQDVLDLLTQQDKIANKAKDISGRVLGRKLNIPVEIRDSFMVYLERCLDATKQATRVINELDDLLETGFRGREVRLVEDMIVDLDKIEDDTDVMQVSLRRELLQLESQLNPVDVMFLYSIIEWVGELADISERVGSRLELMLAN